MNLTLNLVTALLFIHCNLSGIESKPIPSPENANTRTLAGIPFYKFFEEKDIGDASQGNFVTSSPDGRLFYGNNSGVFVFDESSWKPIFRNQYTSDRILSLIWTENEFFAAGQGRFGKFVNSHQQGLELVEIGTEAIKSIENESFSAAHVIKDHLFFTGEYHIVQYNKKTEAIDIHKLESWIKGSFVRDNTLFVSTVSQSLMRLEQRTFTPVPAFERFKGHHTIEKICSNKEGLTVFATTSGDIFKVESISPIEAYTQLDYNTAGDPTDLAILSGQRIAVSVSGKGIDVIDTNGKVHTTLQRSIDYRWASAGHLHTDPFGTLWTVSENSVAKILVSDPLTPIDQRIRPDLFYPVASEANETVYMSTNSQVFEPQFSDRGNLTGFDNLKLPTQLNVYHIYPASDGLYLFADLGVFLHAHDGTKRVSDILGIQRFKPFQSYPNRFLASSPEHLWVLERKGDRLVPLAKTTTNPDFVHRIAHAKTDTFWMELGMGRLKKARYENGEIQTTTYDKTHGLPPNWLTVWQHETGVFFPERSGIYQYNTRADRFEPSPILDQFFPHGEAPFHRVATDPSGNIWVSYGNSNYILWKQEDGSYIKDKHSLALLGERFVHHYQFLSNGDAILLTPTQMFHLRASYVNAEKPPLQKPVLSSTTNLNGNLTYQVSIGFSEKTPKFNFEAKSRNLVFEFCSPNSSTLNQPEFSYLLEGYSEQWSKWSYLNQFAFPNLPQGNYNLRVRTRSGSETSETESSVPFHIEAKLSETPVAYLSYGALASLVIFFGYKQFSKGLKDRNAKLESMVTERTKTIESKNKELQQNARELTKALEELRNAQDKISSTSRKAGMAEVATNVLHNVGNVLNSINIGVLSLSERLRQERVPKLTRIIKLINENQDRLADFLANDPKGKAIPAYLERFADVLQDDHFQYQTEVDCIQENINHIKKIIATQQTHAKTVEIQQSVDIQKLVESAIELSLNEVEHATYEVSSSFEPGLAIVSDKHSILQMVTNFIKNAKESIQERNPPLGTIHIDAHSCCDAKHARIQISDNGVGIEPKDLPKIFTHGFTTKQDGHGFGMHSCANAAKVLGGKLQITSKGKNQGATVTLTLPVNPKHKNAPQLEK